MTYRTRKIDGRRFARIVTATAFALAACESGVEVDPLSRPEAASVTVSPSAVECSSLGETFPLEAHVLDLAGETTAATITDWQYDPGVVELTEAFGSGRWEFTCIGNGATRVTALYTGAAGRTLSSGADVTVQQVPTGLAVGVDLFRAASVEGVRLGALGEQVELLAWSVDALGSPLRAPESAARVLDGPVGWTPRDENIVSASGGAITAVSDGRTTVDVVAGDLIGSIRIEVDATLELEPCVIGPDDTLTKNCAATRMTVAQEGG
jgi:hypothetical protein